jgi:hypothetical protein
VRHHLNDLQFNFSPERWTPRIIDIRLNHECGRGVRFENREWLDIPADGDYDAIHIEEDGADWVEDKPSMYAMTIERNEYGDFWLGSKHQTEWTEFFNF